MSRLFVVLTLVLLLFNTAGTQAKRESPELSMQVSHLDTVENEIPEVGKLLALLNKHLPKEHQIY